MKLLLLLIIPTQLLSQSSITIRHINIVNVTTGDVKSNQVVYIKGNKIDFIGNDNQKSLKNTGLIVDATNKFLIPGLWDMHAHIAGNRQYINEFTIPISLAHGITGIRNMWGSKVDIAMRDSVNDNLLVAPRLVVGTPLVNGPATFMSGTITIHNESEVPAFVDSIQRQGYDFIKVYSFLRHDLFFALAKYGKEKNMPIAGHVPLGVTAEQASNAGMQSLEHLIGLRKSFSGQGERLSKEWESQVADTAAYSSLIGVMTKSESPTIGIDTIAAKKVAATLIANRTAVTPTLVVAMMLSGNPDSLRKTAPVAYVQKTTLQRWEPKIKGKPLQSGQFNSSCELLSFLHKQGVMVLASTDCENPYIVLGPSLHEELKWYVKAGLTPLEALQTATLNPAIFLHKEKQLGTVEKDKLADLVILDQNPLADITNTRTIHAVIMNGHLIDKKQIDHFFQQLKERATK